MIDFADRKSIALAYAERRPELFWPGFAVYLDTNWGVYLAFEKIGLRLWHAGRRHYGQRSVWEVLRYETAVAEKASDWKLNDHFTKSVARLFELMNPRCMGFFEFREKVGPSKTEQLEVRA